MSISVEEIHIVVFTFNSSSLCEIESITPGKSQCSTSDISNLLFRITNISR